MVGRDQGRGDGPEHVESICQRAHEREVHKSTRRVMMMVVCVEWELRLHQSHPP